MNKLWIFGDSYSTYNSERLAQGVRLSIYSEVASHLNLTEENKAISGLSSFEVFGNLLKFLSEYKKGDVIIFQLSLLDRTSYIDVQSHRELNERERELFLTGNKFFVHPQFYHSRKRDLDEFETKKLSKFIESFEINQVDYYFKFLIHLKYIYSFLENIGVDLRIILLEDAHFRYNSSSAISILNLIDDLNLSNAIIKFSGKNCLTSSVNYKEEGEYEYHHFSLETIEKYSKEVKENFNEPKI